MRSLASALVALFVLSLPLAGLAGEGCPHARDKATSASLDTPAGGDAGACATSCPHAAATAEAGASGCACAVEASAAQRPDGGAAPEPQPAADPASPTVANNE